MMVPASTRRSASAVCQERSEFGVGAGAALEHLGEVGGALVQSHDIASVEGERPSGVGLVEGLGEPGALGQGDPLVAGDGEVAELFDDGPLVANRRKDGGFGHAGTFGDLLDGGGDIALVDEQGPGRVQDGLAGLGGALLATRARRSGGWGVRWSICPILPLDYSIDHW